MLTFTLAVGLSCGPACVRPVAVAEAGGGNGLYEPFSDQIKQSQADFLARVGVFVSHDELKQGKFLSSGSAPVAPGAAGGPLLRAGVNDPADPGAWGWALGGALVALLIGAGAAGARFFPGNRNISVS